MGKKSHAGLGNYRREGEFYVWSRQVGKRRFVVKRKSYETFMAEVDRRQKEIALLGASAPPKERTIKQFVPAWIDAFVSPPRRARKTHQLYLAVWRNQIEPHLGRVRLSKLTTTRVQQWLNDLTDAGAGPRTVNQALTILKMACANAVFQGYMGRNPCEGCTGPAMDPKPIRVLSPAEFDALLKEAYSRPKFSPKPTRYRHLLRFMLSTGLRISEALGLLLVNVDLKRGILHVRTQLDWEGKDSWRLAKPKGRKLRSIVLEPDAIKAIRQHLAMVRRERIPIEDYEDCGLVFAGVRGTPCIHRNIQRQLDKCLERAKVIVEGREQVGIEHCGLHDLRRTCLTNLANRGLPMHQLQAYAGHSSIMTTAKFYLGVSLEAQRASMSALKPLKDTVSSFPDPIAINTMINTKPGPRRAAEIKLS